jgi:hypothetical protein
MVKHLLAPQWIPIREERKYLGNKMRYLFNEMVTLAEPQIVQSTEYQQSWVVRFWKQPLVNIHMQFVDANS